MTTPLAVAQRRADVRRLTRDGLSQRAIGAQLGISKDTVRRDLDWYDLPLTDRLAQRVAHTNEAVSHACAAAHSLTDHQPAYVPTNPETARSWYQQLRAAAALLAAQADQFADHHPFAQRATGGPTCPQPGSAPATHAPSPPTPTSPKPSNKEHHSSWATAPTAEASAASSTSTRLTAR